jgi:putative ABC transport system permease protein
MLKNYWRIAWRNLARNKVYAFINLLGLALGICGCLVLFLITNYEFSFDKNHPDGNRIYRIAGDRVDPSGQSGFMNSPYEDLAGFETQIPGFAATAGVHFYRPKIEVMKKSFDNRIPGSYQSTAIFVASDWFQVFQYQWLAGSPGSLDVPNHVVLTESRAQLYFGNATPAQMLGKLITYDDSLLVEVTGIVKDYKGNTDFGQTDFLSVTTATHSFLKNEIPAADWSSLRPHRSLALVKLQPGVKPEEVNARFADYIKKHLKFNNPGTKLTMYLQPLTELHFTRDFHRGDDGDNWRKPYLPTLYTMMGVAIFILLIAAVNFINLSTAVSMTRAREVGVRRVMGSRKANIRLQFLLETLLITTFAAILAILLVNPMLALFSDYVPEGVHFTLLSLSTLGFLVAMTLLTTLLAGFYPAWVLSSYNPVVSLRGNAAEAAASGTSGKRLRQGLIVFQFTVSLLFIVGAIAIGKQMGYMNSAYKGFDTDRVLSFSNWGAPPEKLQVYANSVKDIRGVENVILEGTPPMGFAQNMDNFSFKPSGTEFHMVSAHMGNEEYIPFYHMQLIAGRNVLHSDSLRELVINETLARQMGFADPKQAVGHALYSITQQGTPDKPYPVVGVVADFHVSSFHDPIPPVVIENVPQRKNTVAIKIAASEKDSKAVKAVMDQLEARWKAQFADGPSIKPVFLNESISWLFGQEKRTAWLVDMAMCVTIFISCMGLFGLGLFTTRRRAKEISIRKVLGASIGTITTLLSKDFARLVILAFVIATPLAWWATHQWLQDFVYRTSLDWWVFVLAGFGALVVAMVTVSFQAIRAALANPITHLRNE